MPVETLSDRRAAVRADLQTLAILSKALTSKVAGQAVADRERIELEGPFDLRGVIRYELTGDVGAEYQQSKYYGVKLDEFFDLLVGALPGFVEDHMRKALAAAVELQRADLEGRPRTATTWIDSKGKQHPLSLLEVKRISARATARKAAAKALIAPFSKMIKTHRPARGPITFSHIGIEEGLRTEGLAVAELSK
jgi:hypothetical protein